MLFLISLPVVLSNRAKALSVELAGPTTSPVAAPLIPVQTAVVPLVILASIQIAPVEALGHTVPIL